MFYSDICSKGFWNGVEGGGGMVELIRGNYFKWDFRGLNVF